MELFANHQNIQQSSPTYDPSNVSNDDERNNMLEESEVNLC